MTVGIVCYCFCYELDEKKLYEFFIIIIIIWDVVNTNFDCI